jgi:signal transduction histidine kinase
MDNLNILVVEDERIVAEDIKQNLEKLGYQVPAIASTAKLAFETLKTKEIHLILMDVRLSNKSDGISLAKRINARYDIPIIYLTAYADKKTLDRAKKTIPYGYILKPFQSQELQSVIETSLYKHKIEKELKASREQLLNLTAHLQSVREEERTRVAREIHDELGQALTALKMDLSWLNKRLNEDQKPLIEKTKSMVSLIDETAKTIKRISSDLRPGLLDDLGLIAAIEWETQEFEKRTGIRCQMNLHPEDLVLKEKLATAVFRIFQETLTNITRHAGATRVHVNLETRNDHFELTIRDNGKGITKSEITDPKSFGIIGMKERVEYLRGKITIRGISGKGTIVHLEIPLSSKL